MKGGWPASRIFEQQHVWLWLFTGAESLAVYQQGTLAQQRTTIQALLRMRLHSTTPTSDTIYLIMEKGEKFVGQVGVENDSRHSRRMRSAEYVLQWQKGQWMVMKNRHSGYEDDSV